MIPSLQQHFATTLYSPEKHTALLNMLQDELGCKIEFRVVEQPVFCSHTLGKKIADSAIELVRQSASAEFKMKTTNALLPEITVPNEDAHTLFAVVDFAITEEEGELVPKLIELQGFPSLFGYQFALSDAYRAIYDIDSTYNTTFSGLQKQEYLDLLSRAILGTCHPDNVALVEYDPFKQKTLPDFLATQNLLGVAPTDIRTIQRHGSRLFHERGGALVPLQRIYNRAIVDELEEHNVTLPFAWSDSLDVQWAGHPNWYFRLSKYSLPFLRHQSVPTTQFLSELDQLPEKLEDYVLKPLYSFAGKGVIVSPSTNDILSIPKSEQSQYILMEKIYYADCLYTPIGMNKVEIRCMVIWLPDAPDPVATVSLVRTGKGSMMGARYNTTEWTGATMCYFVNE